MHWGGGSGKQSAGGWREETQGHSKVVLDIQLGDVEEEIQSTVGEGSVFRAAKSYSRNPCLLINRKHRAVLGVLCLMSYFGAGEHLSVLEMFVCSGAGS